MSKKQKIVPIQKEFLGTIQTLKFQNFTLFNQTEINFSSDINILNYSYTTDKILFEFILNSTLNPYFLNQNKKIKTDVSELFDIVKINSKQSVIFSIVLQLSPQRLGSLNYDVLTNLLADDEFQLEFEIDLDNNIFSRIFDYKKKQFIKITPSLEYKLSEVLYKSIFLDESLFPYFNTEKIFQIIKYNHAQLFDFFLELTNLHDLKIQYYRLKEDINLKKLEAENFQIIREKAVEKKKALERELSIKEEIAELSEKIDQLEVEKSWAHYFDLKSKFESKSGTIEQLNNKLPNLEEEKEKLEQEIEGQSLKIDELQIESESLSSQYEQQRKEFLSEKASLDKIDRNLKNWDASVSKAERDLKFKTMKLKDKEKKLKDLEARIKKSSSESLIAQKGEIRKRTHERSNRNKESARKP